jgi:hypothetical protein
MLRVIYGECHKQTHYAECHCAECRSAEIKGHIHNTLFYSSPINGPNDRKYYIRLVRRALPGTNTPAYWAHS